MKKFIIKISFFLLFLIILDTVLGGLLNKLSVNARGGATFRDNYICNELKSDILLIGSSRCEHHYNPIILEDSLNMTCYNAGQSGNGIIVAFARYLMMCERKKPSKVIYDINPDFDLLMRYDNHRYLTWLRSYYDKPYVQDIFESIDNTEKYKMLSNLYRYNSRFVEILTDYFFPISDSGIRGFIPYNSDMDKKKIDMHEIDKHLESYDFDPLKISYVYKLIDIIGKDSIIITISPRWYGMDATSYKPLVEICKEKGVMFLDFANDPKYVHNDYYFKDGTHLNARGADEFTRDLIKYLK